MSQGPHPDIPYGPEDYDAWLDREVLGGVSEPITLVVHDFGGPVGLNWAVTHPDRVRRLVIMNTSLSVEGTPPGWLAHVPDLTAMIFSLTMRRPFFTWQMQWLFRYADEERLRHYEAIYTRPTDRSPSTRHSPPRHRCRALPAGRTPSCSCG